MVKERAFVSMKSTSFILKPCIKSQVFMAVPVAGLFPGTDSACVQTHFTTGILRQTEGHFLKLGYNCFTMLC